MATEIERKFLVVSDLYKDMASSFEIISQGYLCKDPERTVRIRLKDGNGYVTIKGKTEGMMRKEFEYQIPANDAGELLELCEKPLIEKIRYYVPFDGFIWEVDEFRHSLKSLVLAEVELPDCNTACQLPPFVGQEVTGDPNYYNSNL